MTDDRKKIALIVGAGPAGLTAAYQLLTETDVLPIVVESDSIVGGISKTVPYHGNRIDLGGHRFFSKSERVMDWWQQMMPIQGAQSKDDRMLGVTDKPLSPDGPDPETEDCVMLYRHRISRIFWNGKFFDYPVRMQFSTFANMGLWRTIKVCFGFLGAQIRKRPENSLEDFYINRFGRPLYSMFFEGYTTKVWGKHPSQLDADWGNQRVKGLSISAIVKDMLRSKFSKKRDRSKVETSLIEQFIYPKLGPGQLWETVAEKVKEKGGKIILQSKVTEINTLDGNIASIRCIDNQGNEQTIKCDYLLSTMPIKDLVAQLRGIEIPGQVSKIASQLPYRDFITVGIEVGKTKISNKTKIPTIGNRVPDNWIYIQDDSVKLGRLQVFNNWSPYMVRDFENTVWLGLEYFCSEGDELWNMSDADFIEMATSELVKTGIIDREDVIDACRLKVHKAYPAYYGAYRDFGQVRRWLDSIPNLYCLGRNGQHRYNNMDHSMLTAMECVGNIKDGIADKSNIWSVNTETDYHESK